jgi:hypothetical protein
VGFEFQSFNTVPAGTTVTFKVYSGGSAIPCTYVRPISTARAYFGITVSAGIDKIVMQPNSPYTILIDNFTLGN